MNLCEAIQGSCVGLVFQMMDRICVKVQDHLNSMKNSETDTILEDVQLAENLLKDARNSKTVRTQAACWTLDVLTHSCVVDGIFIICRI